MSGDAVIKRRKIFVPGATAADKKRNGDLLRRLIETVYSKNNANLEAGLPTSASFHDLFGKDAKIASLARAGDPDGFAYASEGGAIWNREKLVIDVLSDGQDNKIRSTEGIKESVLANLECVVPVDNPVNLLANRKVGDE